jgi:hypothetical protein
MTGQVKEDYISRMRELGVHIREGEIVFRFSLMNPGELLHQERIFEYFNPAGVKQHITLKQGQLGFTFCQVPIVYSISREDKIVLTYAGGEQVLIASHTIGKEMSSMIFQRTGDVIQVEVSTRNIMG